MLGTDYWEPDLDSSHDFVLPRASVSVPSKLRMNNTHFTDQKGFWVGVVLDMQLPQTG